MAQPAASYAAAPQGSAVVAPSIEIVNRTDVGEGGLPYSLLIAHVRRHPTYFRQEGADWLLGRWRDGFFPPRFKVIQVPAAVWKCSSLARGWMVQLELDVIKAAKRMVAGPKATTFAIAAHCLAARLGSMQNSCTWGKIGPQPAMHCIKVHRKRLSSAFGSFARAADKIAKLLRLPLVVAVTAETGRSVDMAALKAPSATLSHAMVMAHRGRDTWIADHNAHEMTERLATDLALPNLAPLPDEVTTSLWRTQRPHRQMYGYDYNESNAWPQDVVLPAPSPYDWSRDWRGAGGRSYLFVWVGAVHTNPVRRWMADHWEGRHHTAGGHVVIVRSTSTGASNYTAMLQNAQWCGIPDGSIPWTWRFLDALHFGCVPVILSERWHPPFHRLIDWTAADAPALFLKPRQIPHLAKILAAVPKKSWRRKQRATKVFAQILDVRSYAYHELWMAEVLHSHEQEKEKEKTRAALRAGLGTGQRRAGATNNAAAAAL